MYALEQLRKALKAFKARITKVRRIVIIQEPDDQKRDRIERRLEKLGYEIEFVGCECIYVKLKK